MNVRDLRAAADRIVAVARRLDVDLPADVVASRAPYDLAPSVADAHADAVAALADLPTSAKDFGKKRDEILASVARAEAAQAVGPRLREALAAKTWRLLLAHSSAIVADVAAAPTFAAAVAALNEHAPNVPAGIDPSAGLDGVTPDVAAAYFHASSAARTAEEILPALAPLLGIAPGGTGLAIPRAALRVALLDVPVHLAPRDAHRLALAIGSDRAEGFTHRPAVWWAVAASVGCTFRLAADGAEVLARRAVIERATREHMAEAEKKASASLL